MGTSAEAAQILSSRPRSHILPVRYVGYESSGEGHDARNSYNEQNRDIRSGFRARSQNILFRNDDSDDDLNIYDNLGEGDRVEQRYNQWFGVCGITSRLYMCFVRKIQLLIYIIRICGSRCLHIIEHVYHSLWDRIREAQRTDAVTSNCRFEFGIDISSLANTSVGTVGEDENGRSMSGSESFHAGYDNSSDVMSDADVSHFTNHLEALSCCICFGDIAGQVPSRLLPCGHNKVLHNACVWEWVCCHMDGDPSSGVYHITCPICRTEKTTRLVSHSDDYGTGPIRRRRQLH